MDLKSEIRDMKIENLLKSEPEPEFDVESIIYTQEQLDIIYKLRYSAETREKGFQVLEKVKSEYSENFKVGQKVFYKGSKGIITFKHESKPNTPQRWSVKVNDTEFRRVYGYELLNRIQKDISNIEIDKDLNRLSTKKLLKMYRRKLKSNKGIGDLKIKRILQDREHVQNGETKIVEVR